MLRKGAGSVLSSHLLFLPWFTASFFKSALFRMTGTKQLKWNVWNTELDNRAGLWGRQYKFKDSPPKPSYITIVTCAVLIQSLLRFRWQRKRFLSTIVLAKALAGKGGISRCAMLLWRSLVFNCEDKLAGYNAIVAIVTVKRLAVFRGSCSCNPIMLRSVAYPTHYRGLICPITPVRCDVHLTRWEKYCSLFLNQIMWSYFLPIYFASCTEERGIRGWANF